MKYEICCSGNWELNFGVITLVNQFNNKVEAVFISSGHERKESRLCILFPWCNTASYRFKHWSETWTFVDAMAHCWLIWLFFPLKCFWARCEPFQMKTDPTAWDLEELTANNLISLNTTSHRFKHWSETWTFVDAMAHCWLIWLFFPLKCFWARCEPFQMKTDPTVWNLGEFDLISS